MTRHLHFLLKILAELKGSPSREKSFLSEVFQNQFLIWTNSVLWQGFQTIKIRLMQPNPRFKLSVVTFLKIIPLTLWTLCVVILDIVYISLGIKWSWSFEYIHWNEQYKTLCIHNCGQWEKLWEDKGRFTKNTKSPEILWNILKKERILWNILEFSFDIGGEPLCYGPVYSSPTSIKLYLQSPLIDARRFFLQKNCDEKGKMFRAGKWRSKPFLI